MTVKIVNFSARCPFCSKCHHHAEPLANPAGQPLALACHHFTCCGHEFGFSVRRTLSAFLSRKGQVPA